MKLDQRCVSRFRGKKIVGCLTFLLFGGAFLGWSEPQSFEDLALVEGGTFKMQEVDLRGEARGKARNTTVSDFWIGRHLITSEEWKDVIEWAEENGYEFTEPSPWEVLYCGDRHPIHSVSWYDAVKWCNARSEREGLTPVYYIDDQKTEVYRTGQHNVSNDQAKWGANGYRLPTEAEWEFAARGGNQSKGYSFSGSNDADEVAWYRANSRGSECGFDSDGGRGVWPVGMKEPNELGVYDMSGNVAEWCWDWMGSYTRWWQIIGTPVSENPRGPSSGRAKVIRGGSFASDEISLLVARRMVAYPSDAHGYEGFRVVRGMEDTRK